MTPDNYIHIFKLFLGLIILTVLPNIIFSAILLIYDTKWAKTKKKYLVLKNKIWQQVKKFKKNNQS